MPKFFKVDALTASGKSYNAVKYMANAINRLNERFIVTAPSILLANQLEDMCHDAGCKRVTCIHSEDGDDRSPVQRLTHHLKTTDYSTGEVVIMTAAAFLRIGFFNQRASWNLIVDEIPSPIFYRSVSLNKHRNHLLDLIDDHPHTNNYRELSINDIAHDGAIDTALNHTGDEITNVMSDIAAKLTSRHWTLYCSADALTKFRNADQKTRNTLDIFGIQQPTCFDGFKSVTVMGACFADSLLAKVWTDVDWVDHPYIKPRFDHYEHANLVTIEYAIDRPWSKKLANTKIDSKPYLDVIAEAFVARLPADEKGKRVDFLCLANKSMDVPAIKDGVVLPQVSHGLNQFQHLHNAILLPAYNPPPSYFAFCSDILKLNGEQVHTAIHRTNVYQAASRSAIRDLKNRQPINIKVVDLPTAKWLANVIGSPNLVCILPDLPAVEDNRRAENPTTSAEREAKSKLNQQLDQILRFDTRYFADGILNTYKDVVSDITAYETDQGKSASNSVEANVSLTPGAHEFCVFENIRQMFALDPLSYTSDEFANMLEQELHSDNMRHKTKEQGNLLSSGIFQTGVDRRTNSLVTRNGSFLVLDLDGTFMAPNEVVDLISYRCVYVNTASNHTPCQTDLMSVPMRGRLYIFMTDGLSPTDYETVARIVATTLNRAAQKRGHSLGIDSGKLHRGSLMYLPRPSLDWQFDPSDFFVKRMDRPLLDPQDWLSLAAKEAKIKAKFAPPLIITPTVGDYSDRQNAKFETAKQTFRTAPPGEGDKYFHALGCRLKGQGMRRDDIKEALELEALGARSPTERKNQIPRIMAYLDSRP